MPLIINGETITAAELVKAMWSGRRVWPGGWRLAEDDPIALVYEVNGEEEYYIALKDLTSSAKMLDWIFQVAAKTWATAEVVAGLVHAIDDIFRPQATLCSGGVEQGPIDSMALARAYLARRVQS